MAGHSESTASHCRALFDTALQAYEEKTSITLVQHPLTLQLQNCHSVESIASFLKDQISSSSDSGGSNRVMASIRSTISILSNLSTASALAWANNTVSEIQPLMACSPPLTIFFTGVLTRKCNTCRSRHPTCCKVPLVLKCVSCDIRVYQAAKRVDSSNDILAELLESIENFLKRLAIYTQIPPTAASDEMVVKIMMELLSTIALATKGFEKERSSESFVTGVLLRYSMDHSEVHKKTFWREGRRSSTAEA